MTTCNPFPVSMDPACHYGTAWRGDTITKPLTNKAIKKYVKAGWYKVNTIHARVANSKLSDLVTKRKRKPTQAKATAKANFLAEYV